MDTKRSTDFQSNFEEGIIKSHIYEESTPAGDEGNLD